MEKKKKVDTITITVTGLKKFRQEVIDRVSELCLDEIFENAARDCEIRINSTRVPSGEISE